MVANDIHFSSSAEMHTHTHEEKEPRARYIQKKRDWRIRSRKKEREKAGQRQKYMCESMCGGGIHECVSFLGPRRR